jgi:predicted small integral membrane protein
MNSGLHSLRAVITTGLAAWMTVAVINNATDPGTNIHFLANMLSMEQLLADAVLGNGLEWRSWDREYARIVLLSLLSYRPS